MPKGIYKKPGRNGTPQDRFWKYVNKKDEENCWEWTGHRNGLGYGTFTVKNTTRVLAHRFSYKINKGEIPKGYLVLHSCDNPPCVNIKHLWLGSDLDNAHDRDKKGRQAPSSGESNGNSKLTWDDVARMRGMQSSGCYSLAELGRIFHVSDSMAGRIIKNKAWTV